MVLRAPACAMDTPCLHSALYLCILAIPTAPKLYVGSDRGERRDRQRMEVEEHGVQVHCCTCLPARIINGIPGGARSDTCCFNSTPQFNNLACLFPPECILLIVDWRRQCRGTRTRPPSFPAKLPPTPPPGRPNIISRGDRGNTKTEAWPGWKYMFDARNVGTSPKGKRWCAAAARAM